MIPDTRTGLSPRLVAERQRKLDALGPRPPWWRPLRRRAWSRQRAAIMTMDVSIFAEMLRDWYGGDRLRAMAERPLFNRHTTEPRGRRVR